MGKVVRAEDVEPQPWANGGGTTRELVVAEDGSWRISLTDIDRDGPFSSYPGRRRLLTVVDGRVLALVVDGEHHVLEPHRPFGFTGDAVVGAAVPEGPVRALNVIADPAVAPHVTVLELGRTSILPLADDQAAFVLKGGPEGVAAGSLVVGPGEVAGRSTVAVVSLDRA